jgi:predicted ATPase/DNA-binding CsgD family transcriptional regulator
VYEPHTGFVGRERELAELRALILGHRLLCLVGPGGVGKTRLAVELARRLAPELPGTFVALEQLREPDKVAAAIAAQAGVRDEPGATGLEALVAALGDAPRLVVLDAAEHAREAVADAAAKLLAGAPALRILVTSRRAPGSPGEVCWAVPPLDCPPPGADALRLAESDAVRLFVARARDRAPSLDLAADPGLVGELCRRLGGLPLAIELTAGWTGTLSVREILDHRATLLDGPETAGGAADRPALRDVIEASYLLLDDAEQALLPRLTVFAGPFTLEAAHTVTGMPTADLVHRVRTLVDASWLHVHGDEQRNRFVLLEAVRAFASGRLAQGEDGDEAALRERHARHFAAAAVASEDALTTPDAPQWRARLAAEWPDVEQALEWTQAHGESELGLRAAAALWRWWLTSGRLTEGRSWLGRFLAEPYDRAGLPGARALASASILASESGDYARGAEQGAAALRVFEARGDRAAAAFAATAVGSAHRYLGDLAAARRSFERAMEQRRALADRRGVAVSLNSLALLALDEADLERALGLFEESLLLKRQLGEPRAVALGLINLSDVLMRARHFARARHAVEEALVLAAELGDSQLVGTLRCNQARLDEGNGDWASAAAHYAEAVDGHRAAGHRHDAVVALVGLGRALHRLGCGGEAVGRLREAEALAVDIGNAADLASVRAGLAEIGELSRTPPPPGVTAREAEVLGLLGRGLTNREIAAELHLSVPTVERHLATAYRKLGLRGRVEAARYAVANGLAPAPIIGGGAR